MDAKELARETLRVLAMQQEYFKFRKPSLLAESKAAEAKLRQACGEILNPPTSHQPDLFGENPAPPSLADHVRAATASEIRDVLTRIGPAATREWVREQLDRIASKLEFHSNITQGVKA